VGIAGQLFTEAVRGTVVESVLAIAGFTTGVILGVFFLGVLTKRVSQRGALIALAGGLALMTAVVANVVTTRLETGETLLAWPWYAIVGASITFAIGLAVSLQRPSKSA
jgi:Na+/proline symporter